MHNPYLQIEQRSDALQRVEDQLTGMHEAGFRSHANIDQELTRNVARTFLGSDSSQPDIWVDEALYGAKPNEKTVEATRQIAQMLSAELEVAHV